MKRPAKKAGKSRDSAVDAVFGAYPKPVKAKLSALHRLIFDTAKMTKGVGALEETLKWGQPSYLTPDSRIKMSLTISKPMTGRPRLAATFRARG